MNMDSPLHNFGRHMTEVRGNAAGAARMLEIWHAPEEDRTQAMTGHAPEEDAVRFEQVSFAYRAEDPVLNGLSFSVKRGEHIALVGESGCGKSTVVRLLGGLYPDYEGDIRVLGHSLAEWNPEALRAQLSFVTQNSDLFPVSLYENIAWAVQDATREQVECVCKSAGIYEFIKALPQGFDTLAGERGMQLSGGQKQRVAIARALLREAELLILDEATSALDAVTELEIQTELEKLIEGKTAIVVAHRLTSLRNVDRILVLDRGRIAEEGGHAELMARRGLYYTLYRKQQADENAGPETEQTVTA